MVLGVPIQREYFRHQHRDQPKSLFLVIEEQTGLISAYPSLNQGFVKDEVLTEKNLKEIGFGLKDDQLISTYKDQNQEKIILEKISSLVEDKEITTRKNRGLLKQPLLEKFPETKNIVTPLSSNSQRGIVTSKFDDKDIHAKRRTSITLPVDEIFGRKLALQKGPVNDIYCGIVDVYEKFKDKEHVLPIIAMSLRLVLDIAGRIHYENKGRYYSRGSSR